LWLTLAGLFDAAILPFEVAPFSPFSSASGEKVAVRPDEAVYGKMKFEKKPPHPALSPNSFATKYNLITMNHIRK
jgi:hypothetical protein